MLSKESIIKYLKKHPKVVEILLIALCLIAFALSILVFNLVIKFFGLGFIVAGMMLITCLIMVKFASSKKRQAEGSKSWQSYPAKVRKIKINDSGMAYFSYVYEINGKEYTGYRYSFLRRSNDKEAEDLIESVIVGSEKVIRYDPKNPERSVIKAGYQ